jgi:UDP-N-acetylglucosamine--N-acetylmuramyl-(pentapeptide) pyrophosphoryl-undecaprenol N-acetylglucosamine transferase
LVPSPNVAEDHQTKNAMALASRDAAVMIADKDASSKLVDDVLKLIADNQRTQTLRENIAKLAKPNATEDIVNEIEKLIA